MRNKFAFIQIKGIPDENIINQVVQIDFNALDLFVNLCNEKGYTVTTMINGADVIKLTVIPYSDQSIIVNYSCPILEFNETPNGTFRLVNKTIQESFAKVKLMNGGK